MLLETKISRALWQCNNSHSCTVTRWGSGVASCNLWNGRRQVMQGVSPAHEAEPSVSPAKNRDQSMSPTKHVSSGCSSNFVTVGWQSTPYASRYLWPRARVTLSSYPAHIPAKVLRYPRSSEILSITQKSSQSDTTCAAGSRCSGMNTL